MTLDDYAQVGIIVSFEFIWQQRITTENIYSCLLNWLSWKYTSCVMIKLLLKLTTMLGVLEYKLFE